MRRTKVLLITSNHLAIAPGGLETYTHDLYEALRDTDGFEPLLLARAGPPFTQETPHHGWSPFRILEDDPGQTLIYTNVMAHQSEYDPLLGRWRRKQVLTRFLREYLEAHGPDVVHIQHTAFLGYDTIRVIRNTLGDVPLVYTMHEYMPICFNDGQLVRTMGTRELCRDPSPRRCNECFPQISPQDFHMRKRFIRSHLVLVDHFIAPSEYVRDRYVDWGIPADRISVEPQGMKPVRDRLPDDDRQPRNRFAFFGQLTPYKGAEVLLRAMELLGDRFDGHLTLFGANLEFQPPRFRDRIQALLGDGGGNVSMPGAYRRSELAALMQRIDWVVVPSIWWETGPMVVGEAFGYGRPVICSNVGGMSEKVTDRVNGLHFERSDAEDLARVMRLAAGRAGLWEHLTTGIPAAPFRSMDDHVEALTRVYGSLLARRRGAARDSSEGRIVLGRS